MARSRKPKGGLASRRGVFPGCNGSSWFMFLLQVPGRSGPVDLDELLDRLVESGIVGDSRRDVGADLHEGRIATPAGRWGLLVSLTGQPWAYLIPSFQDINLPADFARRAGLRAIGAGYQKTASATLFECFEGDEALVRFESCDMSGVVVESSSKDLAAMSGQTRFAGSRLPREWIGRFKSEAKAQDALAKEFDAFVTYIGANDYKDVVSIQGFDVDDFTPDDFPRIDLVGFGNARLEPSSADFRLRGALRSGDLDAIRVAVADGADLRTLPGVDESPLRLALGPMVKGRMAKDKSSRRDRVATLLELGADPNEPGEQPPVHALLDNAMAEQGELIDLLELLRAHGANLHAPGSGTLARGDSPLHVVARRGWMAVAKYLISNGADPLLVDARGRTPRQSLEAARAWKNPFATEESEARLAAMLSFLADAEVGRADLD